MASPRVRVTPRTAQPHLEPLPLDFRWASRSFRGGVAKLFGGSDSAGAAVAPGEADKIS